MTTIIAYALIAIFVIAERWLRRDDDARRLNPDEADRGTTALVGAAFGFALSGGLIVAWSRRGRPSTGAGGQWLGLLLMILGLVLRIWSARTLGRFYTRTLMVRPDQTVVRAGPYRLVRHAGYLADLILWIGFGIAVGSRRLTTSIAALFGVAYTRRIDVEEALLLERLGEPYAAYRRSTWRLVPPIY